MPLTRDQILAKIAFLKDPAKKVRYLDMVLTRHRILTPKTVTEIHQALKPLHERAVKELLDKGQASEAQSLYSLVLPRFKGEEKVLLENGGRMFAEKGHHAVAAELFEKGGFHAQSADAWRSAKEFDKAAQAYAHAGMHKESAHCWISAEKHREAGEAFLLADLPREAARSFEDAARANDEDHEMYEKAADIYETLKMPREASLAWLRAGEHKRALDHLKSLMPPLEAAKLLANFDAPELAARIFERQGHVERSIPHLERAAQLYESAESSRYLLSARRVYEKIEKLKQAKEAGIPQKAAEHLEEELRRHPPKRRPKRRGP